ncbi:MAG: hypothetical protein K9M07_02850 [Simkaniaceae bacterium]|nr:hypothetical protein [Simkaniaceae bacterium]MCF7852161.1 hypothetical protein [Simkaniaceae bacterium]
MKIKLSRNEVKSYEDPSYLNPTPPAYFSIIAGLFIILILSSFVDITRKGYLQKEDIIINNVTVQKATDPSIDYDQMYQLISSYLDRFERPFTLIEFGASQGYVSLRSAYDFPNSVCVISLALHRHQVVFEEHLYSICEENNACENLILLAEPLSLDKIYHLADCEHFDIAFLPHIIEDYQNQWKSYLEAICRLTSAVIISIPKEGSFPHYSKYKRDLLGFLKSRQAVEIGQNSNGEVSLFILHANPEYLKRKSWVLPEMGEKSHRIISNFETKWLMKKESDMNGQKQMTNWEPGINLITFKMLRGIYPEKEKLKKELKRLQSIFHTDWMINNMIIQGNSLILIDHDDPRRDRNPKIHCSDERLKKHCELIDLDHPEEIKKRLLIGLE